MKTLNRVTLIGRLGNDPELSHLANGTAVAKFSLATTEGYKDKAGNWQETTEWFRITAWANAAENLAKYVKKGDVLYVEGRGKTERWTNKAGEAKESFGVVVQDWIMMPTGSREFTGESEPEDQQEEAPAPPPPPPAKKAADTKTAAKARRPSGIHGAEADDLPF